jgi:hypothetical integral membrane protein (TIGR02206 family)
MEHGFKLFGYQHLATLAVLALAGRIAIVAVRRAGVEGSRRVRVVIAVALAASHASEWLVSWRMGWITLDILPLQLCDWAAMLSIYGLLTLDRRAIEPLYFFALSGTLPALLTPELSAGFPDFRFLNYFMEHGLTVLAAVILVPGLGVRPRPRAWLRAFAQVNALAIVAAMVNLALGTNFMYLSHKPVDPTPFDWFGPWPWYLAVMEVLVLVIYWLLDLPLRLGSAARQAAAARVAGSASRAG